MKPEQAMPGRAGARVLHLALLVGLVVVAAVFAVLFQLGIAPMLPGERAGMIGATLGLIALGPIAMGYFWARPRVSPRPAEVSIEAYWRGPGYPAVVLTWVLWDGGAIVGLVGTLLTGSWVPAVFGALGVGVLAMHGPGYFERAR